MSAAHGRFTLHVAKEAIKFSAAHFIAYPGFRERLHGHNYSVAVTVEGALGPDGYVVDFGLVKRIAKRICTELDERMLIPAQSETLTVVHHENVLELECEDGTRFVLPRSDVVLMPIAHTSAEELSRYLCRRLIGELREEGPRDLTAIEVAVAEAPGQAAAYRETL